LRMYEKCGDHAVERVDELCAEPHSLSVVPIPRGRELEGGSRSQLSTGDPTGRLSRHLRRPGYFAGLR
jgi:hypothetical protein